MMAYTFPESCPKYRTPLSSRVASVPMPASGAAAGPVNVQIGVGVATGGSATNSDFALSVKYNVPSRPVAGAERFVRSAAVGAGYVNWVAPVDFAKPSSLPVLTPSTSPRETTGGKATAAILLLVHTGVADANEAPNR
jgi:hypothetical protein